MTTTTTDRIEKEILLRAPRARVWRALADSKEFGDWFGVVVQEPFQVGGTLKGRKTQSGKEHLSIEVVVDAMDPERLFSFRWNPRAIEPGKDYSREPMTLVRFTLEDAPGGTMLRIVESGFDSISLEHRAAALKDHEAGWTHQVKAIETWLDRNP